METLKQILDKNHSQLIEQFLFVLMIDVEVENGDYTGVHLREVNVVQCHSNHTVDCIATDTHLKHGDMLFILRRFHAVKSGEVTYRMGMVYSIYREELSGYYAEAYQIGSSDHCKEFF